MDFFSACLTNPLLIYSLLSGLIASIIGGSVGTFVVAQRITYISSSISHSILGGIGFFIWLEKVHGYSSFTPTLGALISGVVSALFIYIAKKQFQEREDALISLLSTFGMSTGIICMSKTPGYSVELTNLLIGNILWTTREDIQFLIYLAIISLLFIFLFFHQLTLIAFDQQEAELQGIEKEKISLLFLIIIAITVIALMQVVGIVLVSSMLTIPQMIAALFSTRLSGMVFYSCIISCLLTTSGLIISFYLDLPAGATIAVTSTLVYIFLYAACSMKKGEKNL